MPDEQKTDAAAGSEQHTDEFAQSGVATKTAQAADAGDGKTEGAAEEVKPGKTEFTPEQQAIFDKRLGEEIAKTRKANERQQELEKELTGLRTTADSAAKALEANVPLHPKFVSEEALGVITQANTLETEIAELEENWNGYADSDDPKKPNTPEKVQQLHAKKTAQLAAIKERADAEYKRGHAKMVEAMLLGLDLIEKREAAARKAADAKASKPPEKAAELPKSSAKPGDASAARKHGIDPSKLPSGKRTVMDLMNAMN